MTPESNTITTHFGSAGEEEIEKTPQDEEQFPAKTPVPQGSHTPNRGCLRLVSQTKLQKSRGYMFAPEDHL